MLVRDTNTVGTEPSYPCYHGFLMFRACCAMLGSWMLNGDDDDVFRLCSISVQMVHKENKKLTQAQCNARLRDGGER